MRMDNRDYMKAFGEWRCYIIYNSHCLILLIQLYVYYKGDW